MRYSTKPGFDLRRYLLIFIIAIAGCYLIIAAIPFGITMDYKISNRTTLQGDDLKELLESLRDHSSTKTAFEAYKETFIKPWERTQYSNYAIVDGGPISYRVEAITKTPNGTISRVYTASKIGQEWRLDVVSAMIESY